MTINLTTTAQVESALDELSSVLPGQVVDPRHPDWTALSRAWILSVDQRPRAVVTVTDEEDVVAVVGWAARHDMTVSVQPVGHGATHALDGTVLLRTRGLREITVDAENRIARVGAGVKWGELLAAVSDLGLTGLAGSSPDPSVVGFTLGGGLSWFSRAFGLAAHSVVAVELVDGDGELRRVTAASDPDLFWAIRGGGGDFGIVTALEFRLHPAPHVYGGRLLWPIEMARPVMTAFAEVTASAPDELTAWAHLLRFPPLPEIPEPLRGGSFVSVDLTFLGSAEEAERLLAPLRSLPALRFDTLGTVPLAELGGIAAEPVDPMPTMELSGLLRDFDEVTIDRLLAAAGGPDSPLVVVQVRHLGGALTRATDADGAAGALSEPYQLFCLGVPVSPEVAYAIGQAFAEVRTALGEHLTGRRAFNFLSDDHDPTSAFSPTALERLVAVKAEVDPHGTIRSNRPVNRS
ncbi:FAD-binding oxidoreductase [Nocardioides pocheonensis]|uniref:FAD-binding oxidoreductase n=1 Tax=Nocardioides pocheonensis TaxID=661485 RepID=A0A3N0GF77_9ACTN|nr:FAD-binding oxidoreductase [Nocardioides pocheonensis]RNM11105.1 FAD-binding oxidoreductase [Nocardioides pocheonensis]